MWMEAMVVYGVGLGVTAATLFRTRVFQADRVMNLGSMLMWPVYWTFFLVALVQNRRR